MIAPAAPPLLSLRDLRVSFETAGQTVQAVKGVSFDLANGQSVGIVGESGSGKSTLSRALMGLLPESRGLRVEGSLLVESRPVGLDALHKVRGKTIAMVFQDPLNSLDPLMRIDRQIGEAVRLHDPGTQVATRVRDLLDMVRLPTRALASMPHEISGGMRQRAMLAMALACKPKLLIADEPTTALDVTTQKEMLELIASVRAELGMALLLISHDLGIVSTLCRDVHVMVKGEFVESGTVARVFAAPEHDYSRALLKAATAVGEGATLRTAPAGAAVPSTPVLQIDKVNKTFRARDGSDYHALKEVDLCVCVGETVALVGESGSGKSTLARVALALTPPDQGDVRLAGHSLCGVSDRRLRAMRTTMQPVFQDAGAAFNPRRTVRDILRQALPTGLSRSDAADRSIALLDQVRLLPGTSFLGRYPHELSGGQRQRLGIARALASGPSLIVADEPLSGADISTRSRVIELLTELQETTGVAYLFITHDIFLARTFAHRVAVMHQGAIVEQGTADAITAHPQHDYTRQLIASTVTAGH